jgi:hypothetical protein
MLFFIFATMCRFFIPSIPHNQRWFVFARRLLFRFYHFLFAAKIFCLLHLCFPLQYFAPNDDQSLPLSLRYDRTKRVSCSIPALAALLSSCTWPASQSSASFFFLAHNGQACSPQRQIEPLALSSFAAPFQPHTATARTHHDLLFPLRPLAGSPRSLRPLAAPLLPLSPRHTGRSSCFFSLCRIPVSSSGMTGHTTSHTGQPPLLHEMHVAI